MKKLYLVIGLFLALTSCNNWLDVELDNKVDDKKLFSTPEGFKEALAGIYSSMSKSDMYGQALTMEYADLMAQYYSYNGVGENYRYWKDFDYRNNGVKSSIFSFWKRLYNNIGQANCILLWADRNASVLSEAERNQIRGEALGLRAYLHFDLYRLFSPDVKRSPKADGIPYNKVFGVSTPPMYSVEEVVQLVINDLLEAEKCLEQDPITEVIPYAITSSVEDKVEVVDAAAKDAADQYVARINLYAVKAMLARAYQARGEYKKAKEKATEVIESGKFRLLDFSSVDQSETSVDLLFSDEHIFSLRNSKLNTYSQNLHHDKKTANTTQGAPLVFREVAAMYETNNDDVRYSKWFNLGKFVRFIPDSSNFYPKKMPMIKLSEMYLLLAECSLDEGDGEAALAYVNELRNHRIRDNREWKSITWDYIFQEMQREYVGEGQLWYVYKRRNLPLPSNGAKGETDPSDRLFVFPFPDAEIEDGHRTQR